MGHKLLCLTLIEITTNNKRLYHPLSYIIEAIELCGLPLGGNSTAYGIPYGGKFWKRILDGRKLSYLMEDEAL